MEGNTMVTRAPRNATPATSEVNFPAAWGTDVEEFTGRDLTDKKELIGQPFLVLGVEIERNERRGYDVAYVSAMDTKGTEFQFSDSSTTGVKVQLQEMLVTKGMDPAPGAGFQRLKVAVMKGLRVSEFDFDEEKNGKTRTRDAKVYYLSGKGISRA
jgi:hypothetical protein